jgi:hypothetical protein
MNEPIDNVTQLKDLASNMLRQFLDDGHVQHTCHEVTLNTLGWSKEKWEGISENMFGSRDTELLDQLYWATLCNVQSKVLAQMTDELFYPNTPESDDDNS